MTIHPSDATLLTQDAGGQWELTGSHVTLVRRVIGRLPGPVYRRLLALGYETADMEQVGLMAVLRAMPRFIPQDRPTAAFFLSMCARRALTTVVKTRVYLAVTPTGEVFSDEIDDTPLSLGLETDESRRAVEGALDTLAVAFPRRADIVRRYYGIGTARANLREIATVYGVSRTAVDNQRILGLENLRSILRGTNANAG